MKLSICYVVESNFPFDTIPPIRAYAKSLSEIGIDVHILCLGKGGKDETEGVYGIHVHKLSNIRSEMEFMVKAFKKLKNIVDMEQIKILQVHAGLHTLLGLSPRIRKKVKIVYFMLTVNLKLPRPLEMVTQQIFSKLSDSVVVLDTLMMEYIFGKTIPDKVFVVPEGVDLKRFQQREEPDLRRHLGVDENEYLLGYVGSIHPYRKLHNVLFAFKESIAQIPNIKLMFVGDGADLKKLKMLAKLIGIENKVIFTGRIPHEDVHRYINACDVGIAYLPITKAYDVQPPLKLYEYLACGLPTISVDTNASKKIIKHGYNGILCGDSPTELSDAITKLLSDRELLVKLRKNARKSVLNFDWRKIARYQLLKVYEHTLIG